MTTTNSTFRQGQRHWEAADLAAYEQVGKAFFGRVLKFFVAHWILSRGDQAFFQMELVTACGRHGTNALKPLSDFISLGMVEELPNYVSGYRRKYYRRVPDHQLWQAVTSAIEATGWTASSEPPAALVEAI